jgi:hypothetical protein
MEKISLLYSNAESVIRQRRRTGILNIVWLNCETVFQEIFDEYDPNAQIPLTVIHTSPEFKKRVKDYVITLTEDRYRDPDRPMSIVEVENDLDLIDTIYDHFKRNGGYHTLILQTVLTPSFEAWYLTQKNHCPFSEFQQGILTHLNFQTVE